MKKHYLILAVLLFTCLTATAFAAPPDSARPGAPDPHKHHMFQGFHPHLNLTAEQREKMKEIRDRFISDTHDLSYDIQIKKIEVRKLFTDPKTDDETLLAKEKELNQLKLKLMDRKAEMKVEWRKVLTPEQIRMLDRMHRHHRGFHHHFFHGKMGKGPRPGFAPHSDQKKDQ